MLVEKILGNIKDCYAHGHSYGHVHSDSHEHI